MASPSVRPTPPTSSPRSRVSSSGASAALRRTDQCYRGSMLALILALSLADIDAAQLAQSLQKKYDSITDFSADFIHSYEGGVLRKTVTERGRLLIKKPGKMRWEYTVPEPKSFISDGTQMYSYIPQDKQVIVASVPPQDQATTPTLFLAGKGNLTRDRSEERRVGK